MIINAFDNLHFNLETLSGGQLLKESRQQFLYEKVQHDH